jgi:hypothetical protein
MKRFLGLAALAALCALPQTAFAGPRFDIEMSCDGQLVKSTSAKPAEALTQALSSASKKKAVLNRCILTKLAFVENDGSEYETPQLPIEHVARWGAISIAQQSNNLPAYSHRWRERNKDVATQNAHKSCVNRAAEKHKGSCITYAGQGGYIVGVRCHPPGSIGSGTVGIGHSDILATAFDQALKVAATTTSANCSVVTLLASDKGPIEGTE